MLVLVSFSNIQMFLMFMKCEYDCLCQVLGVHVSVSAHLHPYTLHSNVVPLSGRLVSGLVFFQAVSHRLRRLHHVLQLVRVRCGVTP